MLKFNIKEHKLEELEKYGFIHQEEEEYELEKYIIEEPLDYYNSLIVYVNSLTLDNQLENIGVNSALMQDLYDLIKDGLIIKE